MLKHIVVPLDGSVLAEQAVPRAEEILEKGGKITLLSVIEVPLDINYTLVDIPITVVTAQPYDEKDYNNTYRRLQDYLDARAKDLSRRGYEVEVVVETGDPAVGIAAFAEREGVGAIVMTTHGRTGISRWIFGSVTQKVIEKMPCPVYVVPGVEVKRAEENATLRTANAY